MGIDTGHAKRAGAGTGRVVEDDTRGSLSWRGRRDALAAGPILERTRQLRVQVAEVHDSRSRAVTHGLET